MLDKTMSELIDRAGNIAAALQARNGKCGQTCGFGECLVAASHLMLLWDRIADRRRRERPQSRRDDLNARALDGGGDWSRQGYPSI